MQGYLKDGAREKTRDAAVGKGQAQRVQEGGKRAYLYVLSGKRITEGKGGEGRNLQFSGLKNIDSGLGGYYKKGLCGQTCVQPAKVTNNHEEVVWLVVETIFYNHYLMRGL
jgi:hypothetical protein